MKNSVQNICRVICLAASVQLGLEFAAGAKDLAIGHFGSTNYSDWTATGTAFNFGPAAGELLSKLEIENARGAQVASSEINGDGPTGTLTSPQFTLARNYISFRIGGGDYERDTCVNLLINGKIVKSAVGWRSVVSGTGSDAAIGASSNPTI